MPSLSDKLRALGVRVGAQDLPPVKPSHLHSIQQVLGGRDLETRFGDTYLVEEFYPQDHLHGSRSLLTTSPLHGLAQWSDDPRIAATPPHSFAFLDTETTGLSGGTGTYAFLIGAARFEVDHFHLAQFFLRDPSEEPAQLYALEEFLAPCQAIVTFNGKSFDLPLLNTRYIYHGWKSPFSDLSHVDLLHLARRLWRDRLPSRTLGNLEVQILATQRSGDDIPGWMIPQMYFNYLRSGDATPMKSVFYHNAMDVVSLAALLHHTAAILADPLNEPIEHGMDIFALGKLFESMDDPNTAIQLYQKCLEQELPDDSLPQVLLRLADIYKRRDMLSEALPLWEQAAEMKQMEAVVELAKACEHRLKDYQTALDWANHGLTIVASSNFTRMEQDAWRQELEHRIQRLERRLK